MANIEQLSSEFSAVIQERLKPEEMKEVIQRNHSEADPSICHTHDFIDAGQAMLDAMERTKDFDHESIFNGLPFTDEILEIENKAWEMSKNAEFKN